MTVIKRYWYILLLLAVALIVNENLVQWALAVKVGGYTVVSGFRDAYEHYKVLGYLFFTAFRIAPYAFLGTILFVLSQSGERGYFFTVLFGGLAGILGFIVWGLWVSLRPFYTDEHVSSTTGIAFVFIPFYAAAAGSALAALASAVYTPFRLIQARRKA